MLRRVHRLFGNVLMRKGVNALVFLLLALGVEVRWGVPLQAQGSAFSIDTCFDFEGDGTNAVIADWSILRYDGVQINNNANIIYDANPSRANVVRVSYVSVNTTLYFVTPQLGYDLWQGATVGFWIKGRTGDTVQVGTIGSPSNISSFSVNSTVVLDGDDWIPVAVDLQGVPAGRERVAIRVARIDGFAVCYFDDVHVATDLCWTTNFRMDERVEDSVTFLWDEWGSPEVRLTMYDEEYGTYETYTLRSPDTTLGIAERGRARVPANSTHEYSAWFEVLCDTSGASCPFNYVSSSSIIVPRFDPSDCVNIEYLHSNKVTPYSGTYTNPYQNIGVVDYGPYSQFSCHTLNTDTSMRDPNVGSALRVIPEGEEMSVRLGNWNTGRKAEAMVYEILVDTTRVDMLILKYAAVMEDPNHTPEDQPRFRIEMLDKNMNLIAPVTCNSYDFIASPTLGWNTTANGLLWKDWTTVGIDLSAYHGQMVRLRLTTYDCDRGAHFGYAYYTLSCALKSMEFLSCSIGDSNTLAAPEGFNYRWHRDDSDSTVSNNRIVTLPMDNHTWYCDVGFVGDPNCSVQMSVVSRLVSPVADFDYEERRDSCRFRVELHDRSHLNFDSTRACGWCKWIFDNGDTSLLSDPVLYISDTLEHTVTLVSSLSGGGCYDTIARTLSFALAHDTTEASICSAQSYSFCDTLLSVAGTYVLQPNCDSIRTLQLTVLDTFLFEHIDSVCAQYLFLDTLLRESGNYEFIYTTVEGCDSTYRLQLTVYDIYDTVDTVFVCSGFPYVYRGVDYGGPQDFVADLKTLHGCDSIVQVSLVVADPGFQARAYYSFDNVLWEDTLPVKVCAPAQLYLRDSTLHAVEWRWTLPDGDSATTVVTSPSTALSFDNTHSLFVTDIALWVESVHGCLDSLLWPVVVFPSPEADFGWDPAIPVDIAPTAQFFAFSEPEDCDNYRWLIQREPGSSAFDTLEGKQTEYTWEGELPTGDFDVRMVVYQVLHYDTLSHTCSDTAQHTVTIVTSFLQFPNLVTPNGDGVNDIWKVVNLLDPGLYSMNELWIYNAWGTLVYHVENIRREDQFWNPNDTRSPDGTYYFRFSAKGHHGLVRVNGSIEVVR